jgi:phage-related protein
MTGETPLDWIGQSKRDLLAFPEPVVDHPHAKPWKGKGGGVFEVVEDFSGDTYRAVYTVRFAEVIYVLHGCNRHRDDQGALAAGTRRLSGPNGKRD